SAASAPSTAAAHGCQASSSSSLAGRRGIPRAASGGMRSHPGGSTGCLCGSKAIIARHAAHSLAMRSQLFPNSRPIGMVTPCTVARRAGQRQAPLCYNRAPDSGPGNGMAYLRVLIGLAISAICIVALVSQIDLQLTWSALTNAQPAWLVLAVLVLLATMETKAYRWGLLYYPTRGLRLGHLTSALYIGYMGSSLGPMRLGELVRAYLIRQTEPVSFSQSVGTVLVEKVLDVVTILGFLAVLALFVPLPELAVPGPALAALGLGGLAVLLALAWLPREPLLALLARL